MARLRVPHRSQITMHDQCLDEPLPADHQARVIRAVVGRLDLSAFPWGDQGGGRAWGSGRRPPAPAASGAPGSLVRGLKKIRCLALGSALAYDLPLALTCWARP